MVRLRFLHDRTYIFLAADVARIEPQGCNALMDCLQRQAVVKMYIGNKRYVYRTNDIAEVLCSLHIRHSQSYDIAAGSRQRLNLRSRCRCIRCLGIRHGLHGNGCSTADCNRPYMNLPCHFTFYHIALHPFQPPENTRTISFLVANIISVSKRAMPTDCA